MALRCGRACTAAGGFRACTCAEPPHEIVHLLSLPCCCVFLCNICTHKTLQLHNYLAQNVLKKPVVIEEFGLTWFKKTPAQQRVLFKVRSLNQDLGVSS